MLLPMESWFADTDAEYTLFTRGSGEAANYQQRGSIPLESTCNVVVDYSQSIVPPEP